MAYRKSGTQDPKVGHRTQDPRLEPLGGTLTWDPMVGPYGGIVRWDPKVGPLSSEKLLKTFTNTLNPESTTEK